MINKLRLFLIRLLIGKTPIIANVNYKHLHLGACKGGYFYNCMYTP